MRPSDRSRKKREKKREEARGLADWRDAQKEFIRSRWHSNGDVLARYSDLVEGYSCAEYAKALRQAMREADERFDAEQREHSLDVMEREYVDFFRAKELMEKL